MKLAIKTLTLFLLALPGLALIPFNPDIHTLESGSITTTTGHLAFSDRVVNTNTTFTLKLYNGSSATLDIEHVTTANGYFQPQYPWPENVAPMDSVEISIVFTPFTNIAFSDYLLIETVECIQTVPVELSGNGWLMPSAYLPTFNLFDEALEDALAEIFPGQVTLGYNSARALMYGHVDNFNDSLECVYTGFRQYHPEGSTSTFPDPINCEHSWPQSAFNSMEPMQSDMHHLFPTLGSANSARSYYPFGNVVSNVTWEMGGSRRGQNDQNDIVFEPRDVHKGDAARVIFYFITRHGNYETWFGTAQQADLLEWFYEDPVSQKEIDRNNDIFSYQENRNPFVDHPYFLERISNIALNVNRPDSSVQRLSPPERHLGHDGHTTADTMTLLVMNAGSLGFQVSNVTSNHPDFQPLFGSTFIVEPGNLAEVQVRVEYSQENASAELQVLSNATIVHDASVQLSYAPTVSIDAFGPDAFALMKAYPNPFNGGGSPGATHAFCVSGRIDHFRSHGP